MRTQGRTSYERAASSRWSNAEPAIAALRWPMLLGTREPIAAVMVHSREVFDTFRTLMQDNDLTRVRALIRPR